MAVSKAMKHVLAAVEDAEAAHSVGQINSSQALCDVRVSTMSQLTRMEIENCLYMAIGADGVAELIASTLGDLQKVAKSNPRDSINDEQR